VVALLAALLPTPIQPRSPSHRLAATQAHLALRAVDL